MNYIHFTENFKNEILEDSKKELIYKRIENFQNIEKLETLNSVDNYRGVFVAKFSKTNLCRIIIQYQDIKINEENLSVLFVREYISKKNFDYYWGHVIYPQLKNHEWLKNNPLPDSEIAIFKEQYLIETQNNKSSRTQLPERLAKWLPGFQIKLEFDVFEREDWVLYSNDKTNNGLRERDIDKFKKTIKKIIDNSNDGNITKKKIGQESNVYSVINEEENIGIIVSDFENIEGRRIILLHNGAHIKIQPQQWSEALNKAEKEENHIKADLEIISKDAFRAYPKWILGDNADDYWSAIQRHDGTHNLSLLPEQIGFLNRFSFPTYINGQAGSGKSTMLYYLFANIFSYYKSGEFDGDFIFLTENDTLLEHTIKSVTGLLVSNPEFDFGFDIKDKISVRNHFSSFKDFLINILPVQERTNFSKEKYLDFAKFKEIYYESYEEFVKRISAEEVWFVISTYVYGFFENREIDTVEKYTNNGIPNKFRIIKESRFKEIINRALPIYNSLINDGWWDRITLVRQIRQFFPYRLPKQYSVVFCDEAQDFSRIELRLIIESCEYTNYDLSGTDEIPIVFAGDALQTVSPIGFSVRRLQQMYYDTFKEANFKYDKEKSTYTPEYNYRSTQPIVKLANVIQNYRKVSLNEGSTLKQKAKREGKAIQPPILHYKEWLLQNNNLVLFTEKYKYKSFIVPVDLNEEIGFVRKDELLNQNFPDIKSSIDAKGAEYSQVVVYGFADEYVNEFGDLNWNSNEYDFKKKFFFNKLYVAITRAQNELIIIDSREGCDRFWKPLLNPPKDIKERWEAYESIDEVLPINPETGLQNSLTSTQDDALNNAKIDMEQGIKDKNIARLIVASNIFTILGREKEAFICQGHKESIKTNWVKAGDHFLKAGELEMTANAYFQGKAWNKLNVETKSLQGNKQMIRSLVSQIMNNRVWEKSDLNRMYELRGVLRDVIHDINWYEDFKNKMIVYSGKINNLGEKRDLVIILEQIVKDEDENLINVIAELYFDTKQYDLAISCWDKIYFNDSNPIYSTKYIRAQIGNSKDEKKVHDEILWTGRLVLANIDIEVGERTKLIVNIYETYKDNNELFQKSEVKDELQLYVYISAIYLSEYQTISDVGKIVESNYTCYNDLKELYAKLIIQNANEEICIFLKERWAKSKMNELNYDKVENKALLLEQINNEFESKKFPFKESNQPWTTAELSEISEWPEFILTNPNEHLKNIVISNFRKFERLEVKNLGQFNLILGDNNSGKTTFLESILFSPNPDQCFLNYLYAIQQRNNNAKNEEKESFIESLIYNNDNKREIKYMLKKGRRFWSYIIRIPEENELDSLELDKRHFLLIESQQQKKEISQHIDILLKSLNNPDTIKTIPFIPFGKGYSEKLASVYLSEIGGERKLRQNFRKQLKLFIPDIVGVVVDTNQELVEIEEELNDVESRHALHVYGEGANKLFRILVQLHAAKNKRLAIDEIDAGIHHSHFKEFWKIILKTAKDYNVQLFATTHNEECIRYFWEVLSEEGIIDWQDESRIITLDKHVKTDEITPIVRDFKNMKYAYEHHLEIRGRV